VFEAQRYRFVLQFRDDTLVTSNHANCTTDSCLYDDVWGPYDCNYITWNQAVCTYPHFLSDDTNVTWLCLIQENIGVPQDWKIQEGKQVCFGSPVTKVRYKWIVNLPTPNSDSDSNSTDGEADIWEKLAERTFNTLKIFSKLKSSMTVMKLLSTSRMNTYNY
jgi:hypothetical protein